MPVWSGICQRSTSSTTTPIEKRWCLLSRWLRLVAKVFVMMIQGGRFAGVADQMLASKLLRSFGSARLVTAFNVVDKWASVSRAPNFAAIGGT
jgi:hypothetical protein